MSDSSVVLDCPLHGSGVATFVCRHLETGIACGFHHRGEAGDPWPDAWCDLCSVRPAGSSPDAVELRRSLGAVCSGCYEEARERNERSLAPLVSGELQLSHDRFREFIEVAARHTQACQDRTEEAFGFLQYERWSVTTAGELVFHDALRTHELVADAEIIGSLSQDNGSWTWAWGDEDLEPELRQRLVPVRTFGEVRGLAALTEPAWPADEIDGWEMTSVANYLMGGDAVYRAPIEQLQVFMMLRNLRVRAVLDSRGPVA
jgi:hypothetical protein